MSDTGLNTENLIENMEEEKPWWLRDKELDKIKDKIFDIVEEKREKLLYSINSEAPPWKNFLIRIDSLYLHRPGRRDDPFWRVDEKEDKIKVRLNGLFYGDISPDGVFEFEISKDEIVKKAREFGVIKEAIIGEFAHIGILHGIVDLLIYEKLEKDPELREKVVKAVVNKLEEINDAIIGRSKAKLEEAS